MMSLNGQDAVLHVLVPDHCLRHLKLEAAFCMAAFMPLRESVAACIDKGVSGPCEAAAGCRGGGRAARALRPLPCSEVPCMACRTFTGRSNRPGPAIALSTSH